jgi:hypothetical protein
MIPCRLLWGNSFILKLPVAARTFFTMIFSQFSDKLNYILQKEECMAEKSKQKKENKKAPLKTLKEKRKEKQEKKGTK